MAISARQVDGGVVGMRLVAYSHEGEDPATRPVDDRAYGTVITGVARGDGNVATVICGGMRVGLGDKGWIEVAP